PLLFETVRGADREADFGGAHFQSLGLTAGGFFGGAQRNAGAAHRLPSLDDLVDRGRRESDSPSGRLAGPFARDRSLSAARVRSAAVSGPIGSPRTVVGGSVPARRRRRGGGI